MRQLKDSRFRKQDLLHQLRQRIRVSKEVYEKAKAKIFYSRKDKYSIKHVYYCHCEVAKGSRGNLRIMEFTLREKTEVVSLNI